MNWQRWIRPGLILTLLVAVVSVFAEKGAIEEDLRARVSGHLVAAGMDWVEVETSARAVVISGMAPSVEAQEFAARAASQVPGVGVVEDRSALLPIASPFVWTAQRTGASVVLAGSVPSEGARVAVLAAARRALPDATIRDEMSLARGAPASFTSATSFSLTNLAKLSEGTVTLTDGTLAVSGIASSAASYAGAREAFTSALPANVALGPLDVLPARADPFVWAARYDGERISLGGYAPNEIAHDMLLASIRTAFPEAQIEDTVAVASGEPAGFADAATFAVGALQRLSQGSVTLDGVLLDVTGDARSVDDYDALLTSLENAKPDGFTVLASAVRPAPVSPYGWRGERTAGAVVLEGYVPDAVVLRELTDSARILFAGAEIENRIRVAAGEPQMDWIGAVKFAMAELAKLKSGSVELTDRTYAIEGEASSPEAYADIQAANRRTLPASLELGEGEVLPPVVSPYVFVVERQGRGVILRGNVPDFAAREEIVALAQERFPAGSVISEELVFAAGAPESFAEAVALSLRVLQRAAGGRVTLRDTAVEVRGSVYSLAVLEDVGELLEENLPAAFSLAAVSLPVRQAGQPADASACNNLVQAVLRQGGVTFESSRGEIAAESYPALDRVAAALQRCPAVAMEVAAHTDSQGSASRNRNRTQARAEAVVEFLVDAGIRRERLTPVGYGEDKPVADNGTEEGRLANRRVEFTPLVPEPASESDNETAPVPGAAGDAATEEGG